MIRKIIAFAAACAMCLTVSSCGCSVGGLSEPTPTPVVEVIPSALLTINDAITQTGNQLVQEGGIEKENGASYVLYRGEPVGAADIVKVSIEQYSAGVPKEAVKQKFDNDRLKRTSAEAVEGMENCYIAFPTVYYYKDGYYVKITAGSGDTDEQKKLLTSLIQLAATNLDGFIA